MLQAPPGLFEVARARRPVVLHQVVAELIVGHTCRADHEWLLERDTRLFLIEEALGYALVGGLGAEPHTLAVLIELVPPHVPALVEMAHSSVTPSCS